MSKLGRNDPCHCGSGKKYKKCCLNKESSIVDLTWQKMRQTESNLVPQLLKYLTERFRESALAEAWAEFNLADVDLPNNEPPLEFETIFLPWVLFNWIDDGYFDVSRTDLVDKPVALLYLEEKSQKLDVFQQRFIRAACEQQFSFYVVTDVVPGQRLDLKDLILNRTVRVHERQGSQMLNVGQIIFARVVTMDNNSIIVGFAPTVIPAGYHGYFIDLREDWKSRLDKLGKTILFEFEDEIRDIYHEIIEQINNPQPPKLANTEGDTLELTKLYYQLNCSPEQALSALRTLSATSEQALLRDGQFDSDGNLQSIEVPWLEKIGSEQMPGQTTLKGTLTISENKLTIDVNSRERAAAIKRKISRRLGKRALFKTSVIESIEKILEDAQSQDSSAVNQTQATSNELQAQPEVQSMLIEMAKKHWTDWLDTPLPALKNQTPRESAKTEAGRERLDALFLQFEGMNSHAEQNVFEPDIDSLKKELGYF